MDVLAMLVSRSSDGDNGDSEATRELITRERANLNRDIDRLNENHARQLGQLTDRLNALDEIPATDPLEDGEVMSLVIEYDDRSQYQFVVMRGNGLYHFTGNSFGDRPRAWYELAAYLIGRKARIVPGSIVKLTPAVEQVTATPDADAGE